MFNKIKLAFLICFCLFVCTLCVQANDRMPEISKAIYDMTRIMLDAVQSPQVGSVGGEWAVIGLARSGTELPTDYAEKYYAYVQDYVKQKNGVLHTKKYTEYSRVALALTAVGYDPRDIDGFNLLTPLGDYDKTLAQGINGPIWALIALDSKNYDMPVNASAKTQATRDMYVECILDRQRPDGGWALAGEGTDPDLTAMALQALSKYQAREDVSQAVQKGIQCLSELQNQNGGFVGRGAENLESCVQTIVALCELGQDPCGERFVKNGNTLIDCLLSYYSAGSGFSHTYYGEPNQMACEQGLYCLVAIDRLYSGQNSLYSMGDAKKCDGDGLVGKEPNVHGQKPTATVLFGDTQNRDCQSAVEALAARHIINGKSEGVFDPDAYITRAEFAAVVVRGLGLPAVKSDMFDDVKKSDWFYDCVCSAHFYGIVNGVSRRLFDPNGNLTRQEAAAMVARAARLCGFDCDLPDFVANDAMSNSPDAYKISDWAKSSVAFCRINDLLPVCDGRIMPDVNATRGDVALLVYRLLCKARLL